MKYDFQTITNGITNKTQMNEKRSVKGTLWDTSSKSEVAMIVINKKFTGTESIIPAMQSKLSTA